MRQANSRRNRNDGPLSSDFSEDPTTHVLFFFLTCVFSIVMMDFYKKGSLKKNGVIVNPNRHNDSTSYPILVQQETEIQVLEGVKSKKSGNKRN